jgi:hypothetical protein
MPDQPMYQTMADTLLSPFTTKAIAKYEPVRDYRIKLRKIKPEKLETFFIGLPMAEFRQPSWGRYIQRLRISTVN